MGSTGTRGPIPPASKMMSNPGACVLCASRAAIIGRPVPTRTDFLSSSIRAATQARSSVAVYVVTCSTMSVPSSAVLQPRRAHRLFELLHALQVVEPANAAHQLQILLEAAYAEDVLLEVSFRA